MVMPTRSCRYVETCRRPWRKYWISATRFVVPWEFWQRFCWAWFVPDCSCVDLILPRARMENNRARRRWPCNSLMFLNLRDLQDWDKRLPHHAWQEEHHKQSKDFIESQGKNTSWVTFLCAWTTPGADGTLSMRFSPLFLWNVSFTIFFESHGETHTNQKPLSTFWVATRILYN